MIVGVFEKVSPLAIMKGDPEYENPEGNVNTVNTTVVVTLLPAPFVALIIAVTLVTVTEGVPEITPVFVFSVSPVGSDPDNSEKVKEPELILGETENACPFPIKKGLPGYERPETEATTAILI